ncbi:metallophosphoesterase family protein [Deinococcus lacus]|uniref:Metallophosphoesterase family protein n=1 Tax=Deinococcus lacus TaxID=392561 RepID=A0ABW1YF21_9DEIO
MTEALAWQSSRLTERELGWMKSWPDGIDDAELGLRFRHGTPLSAADYTNSVQSARDSFQGWPGRLCFVGHTHLPAAYATLTTGNDFVKFQSLSEIPRYPVPPAVRAILNPGSVGQPRDGDPRAAYGVFDTDRQLFEVRRVAYDFAETQRAILDAGLPPTLAERLAQGR